MLDIVPSYNPVQYQGKLMMQTWKNAEVLISGLILNPKNHPIKFKGKLMNQTWENVKNPNLEPNFDLFGPNMPPPPSPPVWPKFFLPPYQMLDIVASYHCTQFQGNITIQTQENGEKPRFGPDLGKLDPNSGREIFFSKTWLRQSLHITRSSTIMYNIRKN